MRNISAGPSPSATAWREGIVFDAPTIEFSYKNDDLHDPLINAYHAIALKLATAEEIETIKAMAFKVNDTLKAYFLTLGVKLVDFKLEFGRLPDGTIVLADEISPGHLPLLGRGDEREARQRTASAATSAAWRTLPRDDEARARRITAALRMMSMCDARQDRGALFAVRFGRLCSVSAELCRGLSLCSTAGMRPAG